MNKEKIVQIFKEISNTVENGYIAVYGRKSKNYVPYVGMPFEMVTDDMEFTNKSTLCFGHKQREWYLLKNPSVVINSIDVEDIRISNDISEKNYREYGKYQITFECYDSEIVAIVKAKKDKKFELLKEV